MSKKLTNIERLMDMANLATDSDLDHYITILRYIKRSRQAGAGEPVKSVKQRKRRGPNKPKPAAASSTPPAPSKEPVSAVDKWDTATGKTGE